MTREEAVEVAQRIAQDEGWAWLGRITARMRRSWWSGDRRWEVVSNSDCRGMNVRVLIDDASGKILHRSFLPR